MEITCQRCGVELSSQDAAFCAHCGLPQLRMSEDAIAPSDEGTEQGNASARTAKHPAGIRADWRFALRCAIMVAAPAGVFLIFSSRSEFATLLLRLWILGASTLAVFLYHRGRPALPLSFKMGARIGAATGTVIAAILFAIFSINAFTLRYHEHSAALDNEYRQTIEQVIALMKTSPAWERSGPDLEKMYFTPEAKAMNIVGGTALQGLIILGMSLITGGVCGMMLRTERFSARR